MRNNDVTASAFFSLIQPNGYHQYWEMYLQNSWFLQEKEVREKRTQKLGHPDTKSINFNRDNTLSHFTLFLPVCDMIVRCVIFFFFFSAANTSSREPISIFRGSQVRKHELAWAFLSVLLYLTAPCGLHATPSLYQQNYSSSVFVEGSSRARRQKSDFSLTSAWQILGQQAEWIMRNNCDMQAKCPK